MSPAKALSIRALLLLLPLGPCLNAAEHDAGQKPRSPHVVAASDEALLAIKRFTVPAGFNVELFAAEPMLANPVCFTIDAQGRFYVAETFRIHQGVYDIRQHMKFLDDDLACRTVEDRRALYHKMFGDNVGDATLMPDRVRLLEDTTGDGKADRATVFADDFSGMMDGIGAGLLARKGEVWFTCIPHLWSLRDTSGDGRADLRKSLHEGYGVRIAFFGHDLHGLRLGPDGKLYFSIGDRGYNVETEGRKLFGPDMGAVFRCNTDGSDLEVFAYGLRNPQELAFDQYGNLFTGDNNSDGGDEARWVHVVEGGDSGWRIGWQFINEPVQRGPWNAEKLWHPQWAGQAAYIVPPILNLGNGPAGLTYNPGVGLPAEYDNHFFLCDFKGSSSRSQVHTFTHQPRGASFALVNRRDFMAGILPTDVEFGPDGALYVSDWTEGWSHTGKGRIYRITHPELRDHPLVRETKQLLAHGMDHRPIPELAKLLEHRDQRVRQEAQFSLADKGQPAIRTLAGVAAKNRNQLARIHAIWALGQIGARSLDAPPLNRAAMNPVVPLLADRDPEIRAQAARVLGDARFEKARGGLIKLLRDHTQPRVQSFAAIALGKAGNDSAIQPVLEMLRANADNDPVVRHAAVMALVGIREVDALIQAAKDPSPSVRKAAAVALRRLEHADIAMLLNDTDATVVVEAVRAINDVPIDDATAALAGLLEQSSRLLSFSNGDNDTPDLRTAVLRRVLNANFRLGTSHSAAALASFAARHDAPEPLRVEALQHLARWSRPPNLDQVTGLWRPLPGRDGNLAAVTLKPVLPELLRTDGAEVPAAAAHAAEKLQIREASPALFVLLSNARAKPKARLAALKALAALQDSRLAEAVEIAARSRNESLRREAISLQAQLQPADAAKILSGILETGSIGEKQTALTTLGTLKSAEADLILGDWLNQLTADAVPGELQLELLEAAGQRSDSAVKTRLEQFNASRGDADLAPFMETLAGGNAELGKKIFFERTDVSCSRCHRVNGEGGEAGPDLSRIGAEKTREHFLEAILFPNKQIAEGFETIVVTLRNDEVHAGIVKSESDVELVLLSADTGAVTIQKSAIESRHRGISAMPEGLDVVLSKRDLRDLVEFLSSLK